MAKKPAVHLDTTGPVEKAVTPYVLKFLPVVHSFDLAGRLVENPNYSETHEPVTGMSIADWDVSRQYQSQFQPHFNTLRSRIATDEWAIPVSLAAFADPNFPETPRIYLLSGGCIATIARDERKTFAAVVADHDNVFPDAEVIEAPESAIPRTLKHWLDSSGWRYTDAVNLLVIPERPQQLFI